jgi:predicted MPP superfamily phosphohydrolase
MLTASAATLGLAAAGAAGLTYAAGYEARAFTLREVSVPVLPADADPLRVLHISDLHMTPGQTNKQAWVRDLAGLRPDLIVNTGDNLANLESVPAVVDALGDLLEVPGVFVFGSNDYFAPVLKNPARYMIPRRRVKPPESAPLPWSDLCDAFVARGWLDLTNRRDRLKVNDLDLAFAGVDDPHLRYDRLAEVAGPAESEADLAIAVAHAPYLRVLDAFNRDGYPIIFAGHTHGGQLCLPFIGALVTNCDLDTGRAKGLHQHQTVGHPPSWMHVSAGLGTSPMAPVRFCCRPEATLVTLTPQTSLATGP